MIRVVFNRVKPDKEARLREWLAELDARAQEVRATFVDETVRHEQAFVIQSVECPILVYVMEAADFDQGRQAFLSSKHPIDAEHKQVMAECIEGPIDIACLYDVSLR